MINFALTYVVLSRFLLQPFMVRIRQKEAAHQTLSAILETKRLEEQQLIQHKQDSLVAFREHIHATYQKPVVTPAEYPRFEEQPLDEAHIQKMIQQTTALLIEKVPHA